jgi:hypothetical protein
VFTSKVVFVVNVRLKDKQTSCRTGVFFALQRRKRRFGIKVQSTSFWYHMSICDAGGAPTSEVCMSALLLLLLDENEYYKVWIALSGITLVRNFVETG